MTRIRTALILAGLVLASPSVAADQGYFSCFKLTDEQSAWFGADGISRCCKLADGMPTLYEDRPDGVFIPQFWQVKAAADACRGGGEWSIPDSPGDEDHHTWMRVIDGLILRKNNPIGIGVVWWTNSGYSDLNQPHTIRCFVGLSKV